MWAFFVRNHKLTMVLVVALTALGIISIFGIQKESNPDVDIPVVVVTTPFPGASTVDVEAFVTKDIEDAVLGLSDIENVTSSSRTGSSSVVIQFLIGADTDKKVTQVKDAVDRIASNLPEETLDPIVANVGFDDTPIKVFALSGPYDPIRLKREAQTLKDALERIAGVTEVSVIGGQEREIQVLVNPSDLNTYSLSLAQVTRAISLANAAIPIGSIERGGESVSLRLEGALENPEQLGSLIVGTKGGVPVFLSEVAKIHDGYAQVQGISRLTTQEQAKQNAVTLQLFKKSKGNILDIISRVDAEIDRALVEDLPPGMRITVIDDNAQFIRDDLRNLSVSGLQTTLLVVIFILLLLGWREAILAGFAIPLTFFITFLALVFLGETLNFLTLFSLILSLGILVDAAIVVTEGIYTHIKAGKSAADAALAAIVEFQKPLAAGTITTVFAFAPMILVSGLIGEFIKTIPVTVSIVLFAALFVALGVIPALSARFLKTPDETKPTGRVRRFFNRAWKKSRIPQCAGYVSSKRDRGFAFLLAWYKDLLSAFIDAKKRRRWFALAISVLFIGSMALPISGILKLDLFPSTDLDRIYLDLTLPTGSLLEQTNADIELLESYFATRPEVASFLVSAGSGSSVSGARATHVGSATVVLIDKSKRPDSRELVERYEQELAPQVFPHTLVVQQLGSGPEQGFPVEVEITGPEFPELERLAFTLQGIVKNIEGTRNVQTSLESSSGELVFSLDRLLLGYYGLSATDIAGTLRGALFGTDVIEMRLAGDDVDVEVRLDLGQNTAEDKTDIALARITGMTIPTVRGDMPLERFVTITQEASRPSIFREDGDRIVRVLSGVKVGVLPQTIFEQINKELAAIDIPPGYDVRLAGQNEDIDQSFADLGKSMAIGVILIAGLLVWQFNSYKQPLYVISSIPLAMIGVLPGLWLVGQPLTFPGMIGIVALAGIVVNNGIILVEKINENREQKQCKKHAILDAATTRLRPILLTTITTVLGLLPLVLSQPDWAPLGYSIMFGLIFSTVLTLVSLPLLYLSFEK